MTAQHWNQALMEAAGEGALILVGPGAPDPLPPGAERRHFPPGTLIPLAEGARLANPDRPVVAIGGDGDVYGAQLGALLHAVRRNTGVVCLVADDGIAVGQTATVGAGEYPLRPLALSLAAGATFVAQGLADPHMVGLAREALHHPGFALVNVYQRGYDKEKLANLDLEEGYDKHLRREAVDRAARLDQVYTGVIFQDPERPAVEAVLLAPRLHMAWEQAIYDEAGEGAV